MTHPNIAIGNETRPMTDEEYAAHLEAIAEVETHYAQLEAERAAQGAAKQSARAKLAALGLNDEEIHALVGI